MPTSGHCFQLPGGRQESRGRQQPDPIRNPCARCRGARTDGPIFLVGTVANHLFGGSAGREGTAVQIGGAVSEQFCSWFKLSEDDRRLMLTAGIAVGFGA